MGAIRMMAVAHLEAMNGPDWEYEHWAVTLSKVLDAMPKPDPVKVREQRYARTARNRKKKND